MTKVVELNQHLPSVESVIARLQRYHGEIEHITSVITWKDSGITTVSCSTQPLEVLTYHLARLQAEVMSDLLKIDDGVNLEVDG